jgi:ArsR family transcriptional regulator
MATLRPAKVRLMEQFARVAKALGSPRRLELLDLLCQGRRTVEDLAQETCQSTASASQHLQVLRRAGLVEGVRDGLYVRYGLSDDAVCDLLRAVQGLGASLLPEVREIIRDYFRANDALEPLTPQELLRRMEQRDVVLLDVRPVVEYQQGHIPGALCVPISDLERGASELPTDTEIVAYCRGPYCVLAPAAVAILRARGFRARRMSAGLPDWRRAGLPVAT